MSVIASIADMVENKSHARFVPIADTAKTPHFGSSRLACIQHDIKHHQFRLRLHLRGWLQ
jgi:hypothetical protein